MKKIRDFESIYDVEKFIGALKKEFKLTSFDPILSLIRPAFYEYHVNLELLEEGSWGRQSFLSLFIRGRGDWGAQSDRTFSGDFRFYWITSSGHEVEIFGHFSGEADYGYPHRGCFTLCIGDDESENFYPAILAIARRLAE
jgi:hypothetical protein